MIKRKKSIIAAVMASLTVCACIFASPIQANAFASKNGEVHSETANKSQEELIEMGLIDPNYKSIYEVHTWYQRDANGNVTEGSRINVLKDIIACHCYQKIDEANLRSQCEEYGLDFDDLVSKERPQVLRIGWVPNSHGKWYYSSNGQTWESSWVKIGDKIYHFEDDPTEYACEGWQNIYNKDYYFFPGTYELAVGWQKIGGQWYYFNEDGFTRTDWISSSDFGSMAKGWKNINNKWYYFNENGTMASNTTVDGYYINNDGQALNC